MSSINFSSILSSLNSAVSSGAITSSAIPTIMSGIAKLHGPSSQVTALLNQLMINVNNPAAIGAIVTQIEATPGVPSTVLPLLESLRVPNVTPLQVSESVTQIEAAVTASTSIF